MLLVGLCAGKHLDVVLPKLTEALTGQSEFSRPFDSSTADGRAHDHVPVSPVFAAAIDKKPASGGGGWFGSSSDSKGPSADHKKSTLLLCYGYVAAYADSALILSRLDVHVLHNLIPVQVSRALPSLWLCRTQISSCL